MRHTDKKTSPVVGRMGSRWTVRNSVILEHKQGTGVSGAKSSRHRLWPHRDPWAMVRSLDLSERQRGAIEGCEKLLAGK